MVRKLCLYVRLSVSASCVEERNLCFQGKPWQLGAATRFRQAACGKERERDGAARTSRVLDAHSTRAFSGVRSATTWTAGPEETVRGGSSSTHADVPRPLHHPLLHAPPRHAPGRQASAQMTSSQATHLLDQRLIVLQRHAVCAQQQLRVAINLHSRNSTDACCGQAPAKVAAAGGRAAGVVAAATLPEPARPPSPGALHTRIKAAA